MEIAESIYQLTATFPRHEIYGLTSQLRRAAVSVPSNIAEGHTRESTKEYLHHISMAQASLAEVQTQVELAGRLGYATAEKILEILDACVALSKQLFSLRNALARKFNHQPLAPIPQPQRSSL
jgi:four helix bundle protein